MLSFLRKIRKSLIDSNSTRKYIIYAIGEILLVMVGILLALQVNNWNESKKDQAKEKEVLQNILTTLETNKVFFDSNQRTMSTRRNSGDIVMKVLNNQLPLHDSLSNHFHNAMRGFGNMTRISFVGYELLKNVGFDILRSRNIQDEILQLFEVAYADLINIDMQFSDRDVYHSQVFNKHFIPVERGGNKVVLDPELMYKDKELLAIVSTLYFNREWVGGKVEHCRNETLKLQKLIEEYLNQ